MEGLPQRKRKAMLLEDLELAERVEALRARRTARVGDCVDVLERILRIAALSFGDRGRLMDELLGAPSVSLSASESEAGAEAEAEAVASAGSASPSGGGERGATHLTHLTASEDSSGEDTDEDSVAPSACEGGGDVTVSGVATDLGVGASMSVGARKGLGKAVSKAWRERHGGASPRKMQLAWGGAVRAVNAYSEADRGLIEEVTRSYVRGLSGGRRGV